MKKVCLLVLIVGISVLRTKAQGTVRMRVIENDFGIWAYQQHNSICKLVYDKIEAKQLASYNAKNLKESNTESFGKLKSEAVVFIATDPDDPTFGFDTTVLEPQSENYYFFKQSGEYLLLKPFKEKTNLLKIKLIIYKKYNIKLNIDIFNLPTKTRKTVIKDINFYYENNKDDIEQDFNKLNINMKKLFNDVIFFD